MTGKKKKVAKKKHNQGSAAPKAPGSCGWAHPVGASEYAGPAEYAEAAARKRLMRRDAPIGDRCQVRANLTACDVKLASEIGLLNVTLAGSREGLARLARDIRKVLAVTAARRAGADAALKLASRN
jgi:hypothetical protein